MRVSLTPCRLLSWEKICILWELVGQSGSKWDARSVQHSSIKGTHRTMFLGQFTHMIDAKGRITIPVRFRASLSSGAVVTQGFERNLMVYTTESFQRLAASASSLTTTDPEARAVRRVIFGGASDVALDSTGRILLPPFLREYAQLDGDAVLVGAGEYFEIWDLETWQAELTRVVDPDVNAQRFTNFDLSTG